MRNITYGLSLGLFVGLCSSLGVGLTGCGDDSDAKACDSCPGQFAYFCQVPSSNNIVCANDDFQAAAVCPEGWSGKVNCAVGTGGQQEWDPGPMIHYARTTDTYQIDREFLDILAIDGSVLLVQDAARLSEQTGGYFQFDGIAPDDLAAHLGFQDGDIPLEVNGISLETWDGYATAIIQLADAPTFTVTIKREGESFMLHYEVL